MTDVLRTTFKFTENEAEFAALLRRAESDEAQAVRDLVGLEDLKHAPVTVLLHALIDAGIQAIQEQADKVKYARLAEFLKDDPEHKAWHEARRTRRARRSAQRECA